MKKFITLLFILTLGFSYSQENIAWNRVDLYVPANQAEAYLEAMEEFYSNIEMPDGVSVSLVRYFYKPKDVKATHSIVFAGPVDGIIELRQIRSGEGYEAFYDDLDVLDAINLEIIKGEKIAFVGKNGEGKSTLAKMIVGEIDFEGLIELGHQAKMGYYAQNQADFLDEELTVLQTIENAVTEHTKANVRTVLGSFLFSNDDVSKKVKVLSGGERARVALCKLLLEPYNLLVMDEPTNHLDITSKELLKKALMDYDGSLIVVSHDREFLQGLTQKVYEFKEKNIKEYYGDINTFLSEKDLDNFKQLEASQKDQKVSLKNKNIEQESYLDKKNKKKNIHKLKNRISKLEKEITDLSNDLKSKDIDLSDPIKFKELSNDKEFFVVYDKQQNRLKELEEEWANKTEELEELI